MADNDFVVDLDVAAGISRFTDETGKEIIISPFKYSDPEYCVRFYAYDKQLANEFFMVCSVEEIEALIAAFRLTIKVAKSG